MAIFFGIKLFPGGFLFNDIIKNINLRYKRRNGIAYIYLLFYFLKKDLASVLVNFLLF